MSEHHQPRTVTPDQAAERFDTGGRSFMESLRLVLAGGRVEPKSCTDEDGPEADDGDG